MPVKFYTIFLLCNFIFLKFAFCEEYKTSSGVAVKIQELNCGSNDQLHAIVVSPDFSRTAYIPFKIKFGSRIEMLLLKKDVSQGKYKVAVDDQITPYMPYEVRSVMLPDTVPTACLTFSPDSRNYLYKSDSGYMLNNSLIDKKDGETIVAMLVLPNNDLLYHIIRDSKNFLVHNDKEYAMTTGILGDVVVSVDSQHIAYECLEIVDKSRYFPVFPRSRLRGNDRYVASVHLNKEKLEEPSFDIRSSMFRDHEHVYHYRFHPATPGRNHSERYGIFVT